MRRAMPTRPPGSSFGAGDAGRNRPPEVSASTVLDGYRKDISNGFEPEQPRLNPMNQARPQSSQLLDLNDTVQVHLLVETALGDSREYEILSQDEVDDLKKQCLVLSQRIDQTRQNLVLQTKYRDAANSMARLYSSPEQRRSGAGSRNQSISSTISSSETKEAEAERLASERRCEELAQELWSLEKRFIEPQRRLLQHTAGILQMSHKGPKGKGYNTSQPGVPGSPESMYTYSRDSLEPVTEANFFDERSFYRSVDKLDSLGGALGGDTLNDMEVRASQDKSLADTLEKLAVLNSRLREMVLNSNPQQGESFLPPPGADDSTNAAQIATQLEYLEQGVEIIDNERETAVQRQREAEQRVSEQQQAGNQQQQDVERQLQELEERYRFADQRLKEAEQRLQESEQRLQETNQSAERAIESLNRDVREKLQPFNTAIAAPPAVTGQDLSTHVSYLQDAMASLHRQLEDATAKKNNDSQSRQQNLDQVEATLMGLWEIMQAGEEEIRQGKRQHRQARAAKGLPLDSDDSGEESDAGPESFSLQGFSAKVQWLFTQSSNLKEQKKVLQRQIKQQRALNLKSDSDKDAEIANKTESLKQTQILLDKAEMDIATLREQLSGALAEVDASNSRSNNQTNEYAAMQTQVNAKASQIAQLEQQLQELQGQGSARSMEQENIKQSLQAKETELEQANMEIARLMTEVTIARAELDGAYGSRAERAAEAAANPAIQRELEDLNRRNQSLTAEVEALKVANMAAKAGGEKVTALEKELKEIVVEYEEMTRSSIEWEKEREELEGQLDRLRDERESLEQQLTDEKVRWLGMKSPGVEGPGGILSPGGRTQTSTTVLRNEFRTMMREAQAKANKALRAEQAERRRLEEEVRTLKRAQGPGKSALSQSVLS